MIEHFSCNFSGRDFAVGDIHGCFTLLEGHLHDLGFDESRDRLFSVGDLVDRGPKSAKALDWLKKPWFHAVRGNHEQMAIDYVDQPHFDFHMYMANGGSWNIHNPMSKSRVIADVFSALPLGIEVETRNGLVGIVHADCPFPTWKAFQEDLSRAAPNVHLDDIEDWAMWSRDRITRHDITGIPDLRALIVGHTPVYGKWTCLGNVVFIDTGAVYDGGSLTIVEIEKDLPF